MEINAVVVLSDIEGTTTYIDFIEDVLYPFAKSSLKDYLDDTWSEPTTKKVVSALMKLPEYEMFQRECGNTPEFPTLPNTEKFIFYLMDKGYKSVPVGSILGLVWARGYQDGLIKGHVYNDVVGAFEKWRSAGVDIAIYSNYCVMAQRLLLKNCEVGSLLTHVRSHFDCEIGSKTAPQSYIQIAKRLDVPPSDVVYLTNSVKEAEAAKDAGMQALLVYRTGNAEFSAMDKKKFPVIKDFSSLTVTPKKNAPKN